MEALFKVLDLTSNIAVAVLVWRSLVADGERAKLMSAIEENGLWLKALVHELLNRTNHDVN